jgi:hypothetical protein
MAHTQHKEGVRWTGIWGRHTGKLSHPGIGASEHIVRFLVLGLAAAYTYLLLS